MNIFEKLSRVFLLILSYIVLVSMVYILPAIAVAVIMWDKSIYYTLVTNGTYAMITGILSIVSVALIMVELSNRGDI